MSENPRESRDATPFLPATAQASLQQHRKAASRCKGCDLYKNATQTVFGEGLVQASIFVIGEQPGNQEDLQGHPFVGPAGKLLDRALEDAGIDRNEVYITNAVKHFKWTPAPRGKRRLHSKPSSREIRACRPWLVREIELVNPALIVCLGATACHAMLGPKFRLTAARGQILHDAAWKPAILATVHPSAILRNPEHEAREREYERLVVDLKVAQHAAAIKKNR